MDVAARIARLSQVSFQPDLPGRELLPARLMRAVAAVLPVRAAGISVFTANGLRVPLGASDDDAALAERLQFTVGEGPCLAVHATGQAVLATERVMEREWPAFHRELVAHTSFRSILSVPADQPELGGDAAMDLYYEHPSCAVSEDDLEDVQDAIDIVAVFLTNDVEPHPGSDPSGSWLHSSPALAREQVWVALGMIGVGLHLNTMDALATLRGHAYSHGTTVDVVAKALVNREFSVGSLRA